MYATFVALEANLANCTLVRADAPHFGRRRGVLNDATAHRIDCDLEWGTA